MTLHALQTLKSYNNYVNKVGNSPNCPKRFIGARFLGLGIPVAELSLQCAFITRLFVEIVLKPLLVILAVTCCCLKTRVKNMNQAVQPWNTAKIVAALFMGFISSLWLSWTLPNANYSIQSSLGLAANPPRQAAGVQPSAVNPAKPAAAPVLPKPAPAAPLPAPAASSTLPLPHPSPTPAKPAPTAVPTPAISKEEQALLLAISTHKLKLSDLQKLVDGQVKLQVALNDLSQHQQRLHQDQSKLTADSAVHQKTYKAYQDFLAHKDTLANQQKLLGQETQRYNQEFQKLEAAQKKLEADIKKFEAESAKHAKGKPVSAVLGDQVALESAKRAFQAAKKQFEADKKDQAKWQKEADALTQQAHQLAEQRQQVEQESKAITALQASNAQLRATVEAEENDLQEKRAHIDSQAAPAFHEGESSPPPQSPPGPAAAAPASASQPSAAAASASASQPLPAGTVAGSEPLKIEPAVVAATPGPETPASPAKKVKTSVLDIFRKKKPLPQLPAGAGAGAGVQPPASPSQSQKP